jgi:FKBP-type peptidyl-prolyl cis-trans isomerase SlyD
MKAQVISFRCIMKNKLGQILSSSFIREAINQSDSGNDRLPGLVNGLQSVQVGEKRTIAVPADHAYGIYDPELIIELRRSELAYGDRITRGSQILRRHGHSSEERLFRVIRLDGDSVIIDGNHPLAGHDLVFEVEILSAREAQDADFLDASPLVHSQLVH